MFRRFLLIWALLPALCLGLLGQGHALVLCQEACGCVAVETAHGAKGRAHDHDHADCGHAEKTDSGCTDTALDAGDHVAPNPVEMPNLALFAIVLLDWKTCPVPCATQVCALPCLARGPPGQWHSSPPQVLACVRSVVMVI